MAPDRRLAIPDSLLPILTRGARECAPDAFVFSGRAPGRHLSERHAERLIAGAARTAGLLKPVCCMTLRHSYAVARLNAGHNIRDIQESLGHRRLETTLAYDRYRATSGIPSPAEHLKIALSSSPTLASVMDSDVGPVEGIPPETASSRTLNPEHRTLSAAPAIDAAIDAGSAELPFPEIPGGWQAFLAWLRRRRGASP